MSAREMEEIIPFRKARLPYVQVTPDPEPALRASPFHDHKLRVPPMTADDPTILVQSPDPDRSEPMEREPVPIPQDPFHLSQGRDLRGIVHPPGTDPMPGPSLVAIHLQSQAPFFFLSQNA